MSRVLDVATRGASRALYEAKTLVAQYPSLALPAARLRRHWALVRPGTDILIEGYPRSANSFSVAAFRLAQGRPVEIAHHTHAPAHVMAALKLGVPALVLIREPEDSVLEFVIVRHDLTLHQALRGYVRFYEPLLPHRRRFVVGPFPEVITDFGAVIRRVNERFGTGFRQFEHTEENVRECFEQMDAYWRGRVGPDRSAERFVGRPSEVRERWKDAMREGFQSPALATLHRKAERLYRIFASERS